MKPKIYTMVFSVIYPMYLRKAERKGRTKSELDAVICWLTGYDGRGLAEQIEKNADFEAFFKDAQQFNKNASKITGLICGCRVEEIEDEVVRKTRYLDKLVDELAKGRPLDKILRD